ncbi:5'/3'-nucleotidase SurE [Rhodococcus sp. UNC363MFTsu5.1]|uniref:5'/3'-nucleotidase SurE n=1 Tax=Rhodococcus sp. UNC363MFTsu5.1 TaxID=1449069 RepID=UPI0009DE338D|nr:5'/3'-nucleotidase SurE [Rhodococcus sp. UNC363MFTsu5.1]
MRALVVNDDGVDSVGIEVLTRVAVAAGLDVVVAAPNVDRSGSSAALTALETGGRLVVAPRRFDSIREVEVTAVEASPALIVFVASSGAFGPPPDLVLSGINHGPNTGHAILHSGTVGAALTGAGQGALAMAVSVDSVQPEHWETASAIARRAIDWVMTRGEPGTVLNVNMPDVPLSSVRGLRPARLAAFGAVQAELDRHDRHHIMVTFSQDRRDESESTDAGLLRRGWATATALRVPFEATEVDLGALSCAGEALVEAGSGLQSELRSPRGPATGNAGPR